MTEQTIDLTKDLNRWYEMSSADFDNQRSQVRDKSGNGIPASVDGALTFGVSGPEGFDAANNPGDGSAIYSADNEQTDEYTIAGLWHPDNTVDETQYGVVREDGFYDRVGIYWNGQIKLSVRNDTGSITNFTSATEDSGGDQSQFSIPQEEENNWHFLSVRVDMTSDPQVVEARLDDIEKRFENTGFVHPNIENFTIGSLATNQNYANYGEVAFGAMWNRYLNDAEIEYLANMSGPRRSQL